MASLLDALFLDSHPFDFDGVFNPAFQALAIVVAGAKRVLVEDNVVDLALSDPIRDERCGQVHYQNNRTSGGALIQGLQAVAPTARRSELETNIEDVLVFT